MYHDIFIKNNKKFQKIDFIFFFLKTKGQKLTTVNLLKALQGYYFNIKPRPQTPKSPKPKNPKTKGPWADTKISWTTSERKDME